MTLKHNQDYIRYRSEKSRKTPEQNIKLTKYVCKILQGTQFFWFRGTVFHLELNELRKKRPKFFGNF